MPLVVVCSMTLHKRLGHFLEFRFAGFQKSFCEFLAFLAGLNSRLGISKQQIKENKRKKEQFEL
jgi:hypothetical protein